ncbi:hypothetical protein BDP67DRAFT_570574 [Colletotrichum lupini]|nr:hypothetical protein BDP67DRAFT_570574 [Colletotrichum lupini]
MVTNSKERSGIKSDGRQFQDRQSVGQLSSVDEKCAELKKRFEEGPLAESCGGRSRDLDINGLGIELYHLPASAAGPLPTQTPKLMTPAGLMGIAHCQEVWPSSRQKYVLEIGKYGCTVKRMPQARLQLASRRRTQRDSELPPEFGRKTVIRGKRGRVRWCLVRERFIVALRWGLCKMKFDLEGWIRCSKQVGSWEKTAICIYRVATMKVPETT